MSQLEPEACAARGRLVASLDDSDRWKREQGLGDADEGP